MWGLSPLHLVVILIIVLILVGPGKLPETGAAIGKALRGFKDALEGADQPPSHAQAQAQPSAMQQSPIGQAPTQPIVLSRSQATGQLPSPAISVDQSVEDKVTASGPMQ